MSFLTLPTLHSTSCGGCTEGETHSPSNTRDTCSVYSCCCLSVFCPRVFVPKLINCSGAERARSLTITWWTLQSSSSFRLLYKSEGGLTWTADWLDRVTPTGHLVQLGSKWSVAGYVVGMEPRPCTYSATRSLFRDLMGCYPQ